MSGSSEMKIPSKIMDGLYLGCYEAAKSQTGLQERKITHILTVGSGLAPEFSDHEYCYKIVKIADLETENLGNLFFELCDFIDEGRRRGSVLVHCAAGVSRSAATVIAYIMKTNSLPLLDAFKFVLSCRPVVHPNEGFVKQLLAFELELKLKS